MNDEILAGLRNALERGDSLEEAVNSFVNAGYNPEEIKVAAQILSSSGGVSEIVEGSAVNKISRPQQQQIMRSPGKIQPLSIQKQGVEQSKKGNRILLIGFLILMILFFLGALGYLIFYLLK